MFAYATARAARVAFALVVAGGSSVGLAAAGPYYVINETFALKPSADGTGTTGEVVAFLPRRYLLYLTDREKTIRVGRDQYLPARTQDGTDVLVIDSDVSRHEFSVSIGQHEIIFNTSSRLCKKIACNIQDRKSTWKVNPGD